MSKLCCFTPSEILVLSTCMGKRKDALIKHINEIFFFFLILQILFYSGWYLLQTDRKLPSACIHSYHPCYSLWNPLFSFWLCFLSASALQVLAATKLFTPPSSEVSQLPLHALWNRLPAAVSLMFPPLWKCGSIPRCLSANWLISCPHLCLQALAILLWCLQW